MKPDELALMADHMEHSMNIHLDICRLRSCLLERSKVAKVLCAMENGNLHRSRSRRHVVTVADELTEDHGTQDRTFNSMTC